MTIAQRNAKSLATICLWIARIALRNGDVLAARRNIRDAREYMGKMA